MADPVQSIEDVLTSVDSRVRAIIDRRRKLLPETGGSWWGVLASAALLEWFDPHSLLGAFGSKDRLDDLSTLIDIPSPSLEAETEKPRGEPKKPQDEREKPQVETKKPIWTLRKAARRQILEELVRENMAVKALELVPAPFRPALNPVLADLMRRKPIDLDYPPRDQIVLALHAIDLLRGIKELTLPDPAELEARLHRSDIIATLRALAQGKFAGRDSELHTIREYVEAPWDPAAPYQFEAPLLIYGPGGMGKSTLLAEFLLREVIAGGTPRYPFAYFDFDRRSLSIVYPVTILYDALAQVGAFYPENRSRLMALRDRWRPVMRQERDPAFTSGLESVAFSTARETGAFVSEFCAEIVNLKVQNQPLLLVLDTFEEVQGRSGDYVAELNTFLHDLAAQLHSATSGSCCLRVVLSGRVPVPELPTKPLSLEALSPTDARSFLQALGIHPSLTERVVKQVRGVPLTLRLAAELMLKSQDEVLARGEFDGMHQVWYQLRDEELQGMLFERYLHQIPDKEVRKLAHPGLVLRQITVPIIEQVLAEPCGLRLASAATPGHIQRGPELRTAEDLFVGLERQISLVSRESGGVLKHRPELRAVMLEMLKRDRSTKRKVSEIHKKAVDYYRKLSDQKPDDVLSRAEEIYHRLQLGQSEKEVSSRRLRGVETELETSLDELPPRSRTILATWLDLQRGVEKSKTQRRKADPATWERYAQTRVERLIQLNRPKEALKVLSERTERLPGSRLFPAEVSVYKHLGNWDRMRDTALKGIASCADAGDSALAYELVQMLVQSLLFSGNLEDAKRAIAQARTFAQLKDPAANLAFLIELDLTEIVIARSIQTSGTVSLHPPQLSASEISEAQRELIDRVDQELSELMGESRAKPYAALARWVAGVLGTAKPGTLRKVIHWVGVVDGELNSPRRRLLCRAFVTWDEIVSANRRRPDGVLAEAIGTHDPRKPLVDFWLKLLEEQGSRANEFADHSLRRFGLPDNALRRFVEFFRLPHETELFAPLYTRLLDVMSYNDLSQFVDEELGVKLGEITKGTDQRDIVRQLLSWAYENGRFQELLDRLDQRIESHSGEEAEHGFKSAVTP
jgi:hypothetical protein